VTEHCQDDLPALLTGELPPAALAAATRQAALELARDRGAPLVLFDRSPELYLSCTPS
jgi:hypothetical protein